MSVKTAGGLSVLHTEAMRSWASENVNRPSGAQFIRSRPAEEKHTFSNCDSVVSVYSTSCSLSFTSTRDTVSPLIRPADLQRILITP